MVATAFVLFGCGDEPVECEMVGGAAPAAADAQAVVARWEGGELTLAEVESRLDAELRAMDIEYRLERHERMEAALDALVDEALLGSEATARGFATVEELLVAEVEEAMPEPDEASIRAMYPHVAREIDGITYEEARPRIVHELRQRKMADRYRAYVEDLRGKAGVERQFPYPDLPRVPVPVSEHDPVLGPADAPVTVVQFAEYQCFYCSKVQPVLDAVRERWPEQVRFVFKDFPLNGHARAVPAAVAAHCAGEQGRFWDYHRQMMSEQGSVSERDLADHAEAVGLDQAAFAACRSSGRHEPGIFADLAAGREAGVRATPTFYVNGTMLAGLQPLERFVDVIGRELE